jgi:hypothetical protein
MINQPTPASINAFFKCWIVNSGEFTQDNDAPHWGAFWEPLKLDLPDTAKPSCCYGNQIVFYDRTGNKLLKDYVTTYDFIGPHPHLLFLEGKWREVVNGRVEYRDGQWFMRWTVVTNSRIARMMNAGWEAVKQC